MQPTMPEVNLGEGVKILQKKMPPFRKVWAAFCTLNANGINDPTRHNSDFHQKFFDTLAQQASVAVQANPSLLGGAAGEPPSKRMNLGPGGGGTGDPIKDQLVAMVKQYQRLDQRQKDLWNLYADTYLNGIRDPARHESTTLHEFCVNHQVPQVDMSAAAPMPAPMPPPMGIGGGTGMMGIANRNVPPPPPPAGAVNAGLYMGGGLQQQVNSGMGGLPLMDQQMGMGGDFGGGCGGCMTTSMGNEMNAAMPPDPIKDALVDRVKNFQRSGKENAECWSSFCGKHRDPSRHEAAKLQEFCTLVNC